MNAQAASMAVDPQPGRQERLRLVPLASPPNDRDRTPVEPKVLGSPFETAYRAVLRLVKGMRRRNVSPELIDLDKAAYRTCERLMSSSDPRAVRMGMWFYLAIKREHSRVVLKEVELAGVALEQNTEITVALIRSSASAQPRATAKREPRHRKPERCIA